MMNKDITLIQSPEPDVSDPSCLLDSSYKRAVKILFFYGMINDFSVSNSFHIDQYRSVKYIHH